MREQASGKEMLSRLRDNLPEMSESLRDMPQLLIGAVQQLAEGKVTMNMTSPSLESLRAENRVQQRRMYRVHAGSALVVAGALLLGLNAQPAWLGWAFGTVGLFLWWLGRPLSDDER